MQWTIRRETNGAFDVFEVFDDGQADEGMDLAAAEARMDALRFEHGGLWSLESALAVPGVTRADPAPRPRQRKR